MRLLVVDDDAVFRDELATLLRDDAHEVAAAPSVAKAIEWLEHEEADAVLTDLKMPRQSGLELLRTVRARWPRTPVVMITGFATIETALEAMKIGAFDYLRKPFRPDQLRETLRLVAEQRGFDQTAGRERSPAREARELATHGGVEVLYIAEERPPATAHVHFESLDPGDLSSLESRIDAFVGQFDRSAVVLAGVERIVARHRLEQVTELLDRLAARLAGHGPLRVSFDPNEIAPAAASALGGAVAASETHSALEALANPIRRKVLFRLSDGKASFGEVMAAAGLDDSPKLSFHLRKLVEAGLLLHEGDVYRLSPRGKAAVRLLTDAMFLPPAKASANLAFPHGAPTDRSDR